MAEKVLLDTTFLVAAYVANDRFHEAARPLAKRIRGGEISASIAAHSLAETYNSLIQPRFDPPLPIPFIRREILDDITDLCAVVEVDAEDYVAVLDRLERLQERTTGLIYDGLIAQAALEEQVDRLITFNPKDFRKLGSDVAELIFVPTST